jgi:hypothetical protein
MKFITFTLAALISLGSLKATAQDIAVSSAIVNSFKTSFGNTSDVKWKDCGSLVRADFNMSGQYVTAYYDQNASLMAVTKNIAPIHLPVTLQAGLKKNYRNYWVSDLFELSDESGTTYYATVENNDTKITLKSYGSTWTTYKKQRKS